MDERFFTKQKKTKILETIEWDDLWWEHADDKDKKARVLLIGDSISRGYRHAVNMLFDQNIYADSLATSKSLDNASYFTLINYVISQQPDCQVIHFNNGLHGWHLSIQEYRECYQKFIRFFQEMYPEKKLILALSTPVRKTDDLTAMDERNADVLQRNEAVRAIAEVSNLPVNDFYEALIDHPEYFTADGVHLKEDGYQVLARICADSIRKESYKESGFNGK